MSGQQEEIELMMKLGAIEFMLVKLFSTILKASAQSDAQIGEGLDKIAEHAKTQKFPGLNAAYSDLASDEFSIAVKRLTDMTKMMTESL